MRVRVFSQNWAVERVHLSHVHTSPKHPHHKYSEERQTPSHFAVVVRKFTICGLLVRMLTDQSGRHEVKDSEEETSVNESVFFRAETKFENIDIHLISNKIEFQKLTKLTGFAQRYRSFTLLLFLRELIVITLRQAWIFSCMLFVNF